MYSILAVACYIAITAVSSGKITDVPTWALFGTILVFLGFITDKLSSIKKGQL
jgi:hypothetical protein